MKTRVSFRLFLYFSRVFVIRSVQYPLIEWRTDELCMAVGVLGSLAFFFAGQGEKSWPFWILFLLGIIPMLFDSHREISEHGISEKCPIDEKEIAWHEVQKIRIEGAINALVFVSKSKQIRVSWPPKSDAEALLHFLELKRQENGFGVERLDAPNFRF